MDQQLLLAALGVYFLTINNAHCQPLRHLLRPVYVDRPYVPPSRWPTHLLTEGSYPFMHRESYGPIQPEPFLSEFANGFALGGNRIRFIKGNLNIPILSRRAIWDFNGQLRSGPTLTHYNWRNEVAPLNALKLSPAARNVVINDPAFQNTGNALSKSLGTSGCQSAYCETEEPKFDAAMVYQPPKNFYINGKMDFPIFTGDYGSGYRFDRHFDLFAGRHPTSVTIGQHTNPFIKAMLEQRLLMEKEKALEKLKSIER